MDAIEEAKKFLEDTVSVLAPEGFVYMKPGQRFPSHIGIARSVISKLISTIDSFPSSTAAKPEPPATGEEAMTATQHEVRPVSVAELLDGIHEVIRMDSDIENNYAKIATLQTIQTDMVNRRNELVADLCRRALPTGGERRIGISDDTFVTLSNVHHKSPKLTTVTIERL